MAQHKIAFLSYASGMGGAEHSLLGLLSSLSRDTFEPCLYHTETGPFPQAVSRLGIRTVHLPLGFDPRVFERHQLAKAFFFRPDVPFRILYWLRNFSRILRQEQIDLLHANQPKSHLLAMLVFARVRYVLHLRDIFGRRSIARALYGVLFSPGRGRAVAISHAVAASYPAVVRGKTDVIHNGTILPDLTKAERPTKESPVPKTICAVGRLVPWKGFDLLFESFQMIAGEFPETKLRIFGEVLYWNSAYKEHLENLIQKLGLAERTRLEGYREDLSEAFGESRFLVLPSRDEPFGRVLIEAMAHGRPVIAFRTGGVPEIVTHKKEGLLVEERSAAALASAMQWMLSHPMEAERMGREGRRCVEERFSLDRHAENMMRLFHSILEPSEHDNQ